MSRLWLNLLSVGALLVVPGLAPAEDKKPEAPPPDEEFLEFLGSVDSEDEKWSEYLATTDVKQKAPPEQKAKKVDDHEQ